MHIPICSLCLSILVWFLLLLKKTLTKRNLGYERAYLTHLSDLSVIQGSQGKKNSSQKPEGRNEAETMSKAASYITQDYLPRHGAYHSPAWPFHFNYKPKKFPTAMSTGLFYVGNRDTLFPDNQFIPHISSIRFRAYGLVLRSLMPFGDMFWAR